MENFHKVSMEKKIFNDSRSKLIALKTPQARAITYSLAAIDFSPLFCKQLARDSIKM